MRTYVGSTYIGNDRRYRALSERAPERREPLQFRMAKTVHDYFQAWNARDKERLSVLFSPDATLQDWDGIYAGRDAVLLANVSIWAAFPNVQIELLEAFENQDSRVVTCVIQVALNDHVATILDVVDIVQLSEHSEIASVRAYKQ
jgi:hypothetical protein